MGSARRTPLLVVLALALVVVGTASTLEKSHNSKLPPGSLSLVQGVESAALYLSLIHI